MDDDLEGELAYDIFWAHVKILSKLGHDLAVMSESLTFYMCLYAFRPGTVAAVLAVIAAVLLSQSTDLWLHSFMKRLRFVLNHYSTGEKMKRLVGPASQCERRSLECEGKYGSVFALQGRRPRMEDRFSILEDAENDIHLYGVFDGHGGEFSAEFAQQHLFPSLMKRLVSAKQHPPTTEGPDGEPPPQDRGALLTEFSRLLTEEVLELDSALLEVARASRDLSGSTALVALIHGKDLLVANVGDSRGVMCDVGGRAVPLSFDHKPQQLKEHRRIKEAGGFITFNGVWRVAGVLATSRALGDFPLKERNLLVAEPDVLSFRIEPDSTGLVLASDGLWDTVSNEEAAAFVAEHLDQPFRGARSLARRAYEAGSQDNICVLVVDLRSRSGEKV